MFQYLKYIIKNKAILNTNLINGDSNVKHKDVASRENVQI